MTGGKSSTSGKYRIVDGKQWLGRLFRQQNLRERTNSWTGPLEEPTWVWHVVCCNVIFFNATYSSISGAAPNQASWLSSYWATLFARLVLTLLWFTSQFLDYTNSNDKMIGEWRIGICLESSGCGPLEILFGNCLHGLRQTTKILVRIAEVPASTRTAHFPNANVRRCDAPVCSVNLRWFFQAYHWSLLIMRCTGFGFVFLTFF